MTLRSTRDLPNLHEAEPAGEDVRHAKVQARGPGALQAWRRDVEKPIGPLILIGTVFPVAWWGDAGAVHPSSTMIDPSSAGWTHAVLLCVSRNIHQWHQAAGGVLQTNEGTITFKCAGCGVRKPEAERYRLRSAFTVCSHACLDTAAQKKTQTLHDPRRRDVLATD